MIPFRIFIHCDFGFDASLDFVSSEEEGNGDKQQPIEWHRPSYDKNVGRDRGGESIMVEIS